SMSKKISRTYRLTKEALSIIENRDTSKYPNANDFIEMRIMDLPDEEMSNKILLELKQIRLEIESLKETLNTLGVNKGSEENIFDLPVTPTI
ncbi:hypothetical protein, partial [Muricomes intestini]|uniref:hypothetical protein n=2 Tax=Bacillota TaxID=1239 RepID=UPI002FE0E1EF